MKTFLHYTKERELDEGIMGRISGALGSLVNIGDKINKGAAWFRGNVAPGFRAGAGPGGVAGAFGAAASGLSDRAKVKEKEQDVLDTKVVELEQQIQDIDEDIKSEQAVLRVRRPNTPGYVATENRIAKLTKKKIELQDKLKNLKPVKSTKDLEQRKRAELRAAAGASRAKP